MVAESPFLQVKVECPVCKTINEFDQPKVGAYIEGGRDTDFCPTDIMWRNAKYQAYNPLVFFAASCSNCFYTRELTNKYREWKDDTAFRSYRLKTIKAKHLEMLSTADSIIKGLGENIDTQRFPNESAILKLHLAVYDAQLIDHPSQLDLARFYLRIAWLFRGLGGTENPSQMILAGLIHDIEERHSEYVKNLQSTREALNALKKSIDDQFNADNIPAERQSQMFSLRDGLEGGLAELESGSQHMDDKADSMKNLLNEYRALLLGSESADGQVPYGSFESFTGLLLSLKSGWSGVAINEHEALEQAIRFYKEAFAAGKDIGDGVQKIQASYLIAELSRRIGDYDGAKQYFTSTIKAGQEYIYENRHDQSRTVLARKILELAIEQGRLNLASAKQDNG